VSVGSAGLPVSPIDRFEVSVASHSFFRFFQRNKWQTPQALLLQRETVNLKLSLYPVFFVFGPIFQMKFRRWSANTRTLTA
jgi:hypothetical protein